MCINTYNVPMCYSYIVLCNCMRVYVYKYANKKYLNFTIIKYNHYEMIFLLFQNNICNKKLYLSLMCIILSLPIIRFNEYDIYIYILRYNIFFSSLNNATIGTRIYHKILYILSLYILLCTLLCILLCIVIFTN